MNLRPRKRPDGPPYHFYGHGSRAVGDDVKGRQVEFPEPGMVDQLFQHGGHQHGPVGPVALHLLHPLHGVELPHHRQGAAAVNSGQGRLKAGDVVEGHRDQVGLFHVRVGRGNRGQQVRREAVVGEHHPLGDTRRPGSEHDDRGVGIVCFREVRLIGYRPGQQAFVVRAAGGGVQHDNPFPFEAGLFRQSLYQGQVSLPYEETGGPGDGQHGFQLV